MNWLRSRRPIFDPIEPDEIFLDSRNLPAFDNQQFEGRLEKPIGKSTFWLVALGLSVVGIIFLGQAINLEWRQGAELTLRSENNTLRHQAVSAERGAILDRRDETLAWNEASRRYLDRPGLASVLGYLGQPNAADLAGGKTFSTELVGKAGVESLYDPLLRGRRGLKVEEVDAHGQVELASVFSTPEAGQNLSLSIDAEMQSRWYEIIESLAKERGFTAGAGVILRLDTGEIMALASYPEYSSQIMSDGKDSAAIKAYLADKRNPFLNRAWFGLYTPGSIIKPIIATGALQEGIVTPEDKIVSTGELVVPNPFDPEHPSIFRDWKAHGPVTIREALAFSSNVYFYEVGGGFENQPGLGIKRIADYSRQFGLGRGVAIDGVHTADGTVPDPAWKAANFGGESWLLGDTYHTAIGQYGFQVTPMQMARAVGALATSGRLIYPTLLKDESVNSKERLAETVEGVRPEVYQVVREGMRKAAEEGTAKALNLSAVAIAAKTGTAELGSVKADVNSWVMGFWPYGAPRYAFALVMERGARANLIGAPYAMRQLFDWIIINRPEYLTS